MTKPRKLNLTFMKVLSNLRFLFMLAAATFMITSCGEDIGGDTGGGTTNPTTMSLTAVSDVTVALGDTFIVNINAIAGDNALNTHEVFEDGVSIADFSRIFYNGEVAVANPVLLLGDSKTSIDVDVAVAAHSAVGTRNYTFTVTDDGGFSESRSIDITTVGTPPALTLNGSTTIDEMPSSLRGVNLTAVKGSGDISSISVAIDGVLADIADLEFDNVDFTSNPELLIGDNVNGFDMKTLSFRTPSEDGTYVYTIAVTDEFGQESTTTFTVNVTSATPLDVINGVLFNAEGPSGTGGCDLDNGMSTGSSDAAAEIRDQGFDGSGNWAQLIAPVNGSQLYYLVPGENGVSENFTFASIDSKETLASLVGSGLQIAISGTVNPGDIFVVVRDGVNYAFEVAEVNVVSADNSDNYVLNIVK